MCSKARCPVCGKTTWAGCGQHVTQVMRGVPEAERCSCDRAATSSAATERPAAARRGRLASLLRR